MYREVDTPRVMRPKPPTSPPRNTKPSFDLQRFGGQKLPEGEYNLRINTDKQARHIEGTRERAEYVARASASGFVPSKLATDLDVQDLVDKYHGKGIYDPHPRDGSVRERVKADRPIGQYWDRATGKFVDTDWFEIVYSKTSTHIYPNYPLED